MRRMNIRGLLLLIIVIRFYVPNLSAQTYVADDRETLRGLQGVYVLIEPLEDEIRQSGLTESILRTDVELPLRKAGIRVISEEKRFSIPADGQPYLYVNINAISLKPMNLAGYVYAADVDFKQTVVLYRNRNIAAAGATWGRSFTGITQDLRTIRENIGDLVDRFINDYLAVNPK